MKALIIGTAKSVWVKEFIKNVLLPEGIDVTLLNDPTVKNQFMDFYECNGVKYAGQYKPSPVFSRIPKLKRHYKERKTIKALSLNTERYDLIFIISVVPFYLKCAEAVYREGTKVYALFIGSDILRARKETACMIMDRLSGMNAQVVALGQKAEEACKRFMPESVKKVLNIDFGSAQLGIIDSFADKGRGYCKQALGISDGSITICVGHNGFSSQQHLKIIKAIDMLPDELRKRVSLILPLTYGGKKKYTDEVKKAAEKYPCVVFDSFMESDDVAKLRVASDIYINAQVTDALSTSMLEHIYSGSKVLVGSWLSYPELKEWGINVGEFSDFDELSSMIRQSITFLAKDEDETKTNKDIIRKKASWDACRAKWHNELYG